MNNTDNVNKDQENAYQCRDCSTLHPGATISHRPDTGRSYYSTGQGEALELVIGGAVDDAVGQEYWQDRQTV